MELQLFNSEQALILLDILVCNGYNNINIHGSLDNIKSDLKNHVYTRHHKDIPGQRVEYNTYINIDEKDKLYSFLTRVTSIDIQKERFKKLSAINNKIK